MSIDLGSKIGSIISLIDELNLSELKLLIDEIVAKYEIGNLNVVESSEKDKIEDEKDDDSSHNYSLIISKLPTSGSLVGFYLSMKNILEKVGISHSILQVKNLCVESERDKKPIASVSKVFFKDIIEKELSEKGFNAEFELK